MPTDLRFDQFVDGGDIIAGDLIVGLRIGLNTYFNAGTVASQNANNINFTGGTLTNITSFQGSVVIVGTSTVATSLNALATGDSNVISGSSNGYTIGCFSTDILNSTHGGAIGTTNTLLDNSDYSLALTGDGHTFTNATNAIGGGVGAVTVTHAGGVTFCSRLGGALSSRTNFQWLVDSENGFFWLGPYSLTAMTTEISTVAMDNSSYSFYATTTGPVLKSKNAAGGVNKAYFTPQTKDTDIEGMVTVAVYFAGKAVNAKLAIIVFTSALGLPPVPNFWRAII